eukprot:458429_1
MTWYRTINAADIPENPLHETGMELVIKICGFGGFIGSFVILSVAIHTIYFLIMQKHQTKSTHIKVKLFWIELVILTCFITSCLGMALGRCDVIIRGDFSKLRCILGYYFEVIPYSLGKLLIYLLFTYRVYNLRSESFRMNSSLKYVLSFGVICYLYIIIAQIIAIPLDVSMWVWVLAGNVKMCVIPQSVPSLLISSSFKATPFVDAIFGGYLCWFFITRLKIIRLRILEANVIELEVRSSNVVNDADKTVVVNTTNESEKMLIKDIEQIMWKQSILMVIALTTTLCTVSWMWILPMITNLLVYDGIINSFCVHLAFKICNPFWNQLQKKCCH